VNDTKQKLDENTVGKKDDRGHTPKSSRKVSDYHRQAHNSMATVETVLDKFIEKIAVPRSKTTKKSNLPAQDATRCPPVSDHLANRPPISAYVVECCRMPTRSTMHACRPPLACDHVYCECSQIVPQCPPSGLCSLASTKHHTILPHVSTI
jgi:hypothetical protein